MSAAPMPIVICAKSGWSPAIRREHALAQAARRAGHAVTFVEQPQDVRRARAAAGPWLRGLRRGGTRSRTDQGVSVVARSTIAPGHHSAVAQRVDQALHGRVLRGLDPEGAALVCCVPWDWPAAADAPVARRVFDMADDWGELMPGREARFAQLYRRIAAEADAIVVVNDDLRRHFPGRDVQVVRNAVEAWMVGGGEQPPRPRTLLYVGTLSPRFDAPLMGATLERLGDWTLELVGPCLYPGRGDGPDEELDQLLARPDVTWHGPAPRAEVPARLDAAAVLVVPNRPERSVGQDSMKLYDYAARGRPIVSTRWHRDIVALGPPHLLLADSAEEFAAQVRAAEDEPAEAVAERRAWGADQTWDARWPQWRDLVCGVAA
jgi:glycosyltransferase involved in cell wall biosynthesis